MIALKSRNGNLERKRKITPTEDRVSENKKQTVSSNLSGSELSDISSDSVEDSLMDNVIPKVDNTSEPPSTAAELEHLLSDSKICSGDESNNDILKDFSLKRHGQQLIRTWLILLTQVYELLVRLEK